MGRRRQSDGLNDRISVQLTPSEREALGVIADRQGVTLSQVLRDLMEQHFAGGLQGYRPRYSRRAGEMTYRVSVTSQTAEHFHNACDAAGTTLLSEGRLAVRRFLGQDHQLPEQRRIAA